MPEKIKFQEWEESDKGWGRTFSPGLFGWVYSFYSEDYGVRWAWYIRVIGNLEKDELNQDHFGQFSANSLRGHTRISSAMSECEQAAEKLILFFRDFLSK